MKHRVLSLAPLPADFVRLLIEQTPGVPEFEVIDGHAMTEDQICHAMTMAEAVLADYTFEKRITSDMLGAARELKLVQQPGAIDLDACQIRGIKVANTAVANVASVAEHTLACALCMLKNLFYAHATTKLGDWSQMKVKPADLKGKTWGLIGLGRIGRAVAQRLRPFEPGAVLYHDVYRPTPIVEQELGVEYRNLRELLSLSDIVSLHVPLTRETRTLIDRDAIAGMKQGAFLINVARPELVDEQALADAVTEARIAGAAIDVFSEEPPAMHHPFMSIECDRLILTPHVAGISDDAAGGIITAAAANIARVLRGEEPEYLIN